MKEKWKQNILIYIYCNSVHGSDDVTINTLSQHDTLVMIIFNVVNVFLYSSDKTVIVTGSIDSRF